MGIASIAIALSIILFSTFILIFPVCQISFAQNNTTEGSDVNQNGVSFNTIVAGIVSGGAIGAAATLVGTYLNNRHNMNMKKQELKHQLSIELLKHRIECYSLVMKYVEPVAYFSSSTPYKDVREFYANLDKWREQEKGVLLMSENSQDLFLNVMEAILKTRESTMGEANISEENAGIIRKAVVEFKKSLQFDVGVREKL